jgi:hypothetical protein
MSATATWKFRSRFLPRHFANSAYRLGNESCGAPPRGGVADPCGPRAAAAERRKTGGLGGLLFVFRPEAPRHGVGSRDRC